VAVLIEIKRKKRRTNFSPKFYIFGRKFSDSLKSVKGRDVHETFWAETETRRCSFRNAGRDLEAPETLESLGSSRETLEILGSFNVSPRHLPWRMVKHTGLI